MPNSPDTRLLFLFTRTPLHVGAGSSVGAIDQPIIRERHTGFPVIPATSLKGSLADHWNDALESVEIENGAHKRVRGNSSAAWLFGSDDAKQAFAGSLLFCEARLLAFPIRSAKGSYAWVTCPLMLQRAARDGVFDSEIPDEPLDDQAIFQKGGPLELPNEQIVLEEYCFSHTGTYPDRIADTIASHAGDAIMKSLPGRLAVLSNGMMSHFATTACDVAQHVRICDETGTAAHKGLFNQENVPADTLFYSVLKATKSRVKSGNCAGKTSADALAEFEAKVREQRVFQFGGDASTGLGFTSVSCVSI